MVHRRRISSSFPATGPAPRRRQTAAAASDEQRLSAASETAASSVLSRFEAAGQTGIASQHGSAFSQPAQSIDPSAARWLPCAVHRLWSAYGPRRLASQLPVCDSRRFLTTSLHQGAVVCGNTVTGSTVGAISHVGSAGGDHFYTFTVAPGDDQLVQFDSCASTYDTYLRILSQDMSNELQACDDCGPCGVQTVLDASLPPGDYVLVVEGFSSGEGDYSVTMNCPVEDAFLDGTLQCGQSVAGSTVGAGSNLGNGGSEHIYQFTLTDVPAEGTSVQFNSCGSHYDTFLRILPEVIPPDCDDACLDRIELASCDDCGDCGTRAILDAVLTCADPTGTCTYNLVVEGYGRVEGEYDIAMNCNGLSQDGAISCDATVSGDTTGSENMLGSAGGDHLYSFSLAERTNVRFDSCDSSYDTYLRVFDVNLGQEYAGCDDCGSCGLQTVLDAELEAGDYYLIIEGFSSSEGRYSVTMRCPAAGGPTIPNPGRAELTAPGDTAEEDISTGAVNLRSTDLEFSFDNGAEQIVGLRFQSIEIPNGAAVTDAYLDLSIDEVHGALLSVPFVAFPWRKRGCLSPSTCRFAGQRCGWRGRHHQYPDGAGR